MTEEAPDGTRNCRQEERRTSSRRYDIAVRSWFTWQLQDGNRQESSGTSQNISSRGIWVATPEPPPLGTTIEVTVGVPPLKQGKEITGQLRGTGTVLRVSPGNGFAAEVDFQLERVGVLSRRTRRTAIPSPKQSL